MAMLGSLATPVLAQESPAVQRIVGNIGSDESIYFQVNDLLQGQRLYAYAEPSSGNLDPFLAILLGDTDTMLLEQQFEAQMEQSLAAGKGPIVAASEAADQLSLGWSDDLDGSYAASLTFDVPADGDYLLLLRSSLAQPTFGDFRLLVGINAPQVLTGTALVTGDAIAVLDRERSTHSRGAQEISGVLSAQKTDTFYALTPFDAGDTLAVVVETTEGNLRPIVTLADATGKPVRIGNSAGQATRATLEYTFLYARKGYTLAIRAAGEPPDVTTGTFRLLAAVNEPNALAGQVELGDRPIIRPPIEVSIGVKLQQITGVDQKAENYGAQVALRMEWRDPALAFNPQECQCSSRVYNGDSFKDFIASVNGRWPEFTLYNQQNNRWSQNKVVTAYPDGRTVYLERFTTTFQAPDFNFRHFPFDKQEFFIRVDGLYAEEYFYWTNNANYTEVGSELGEEEWYVTGSDTSVTTEAISTQRPTSRYSFRFTAQRHLSYYIYRFFLPLGLILLVSWLTFFIGDTTKRVEAASANLLLFVAWNFAIGGDLPRLGYVTFMDGLLVAGFIISVATVLYHVALKRLETKGRAGVIQRLDPYMVWLYPLTYLLAVAILYLRFFL